MIEQTKHEQRAENEPGHKQAYSKQELAGILVLLGTAACILGYMLSLDPRGRHGAIIAYFVGWVLFGLAIAALLWEPKEQPNETRRERPYLWVKSIRGYLDNPEKRAEGTVVEIVVENAGNVPAFNATIQSQMRFVPEKLSEAPSLPKLNKPLTPIFLPAKRPMTHTLPEDGSTFDEALVPMTEKGEVFMYMFGVIKYQGEDKTDYVCKFCLLYEPKPKAFVVTPFHNECD
jgi:hypothetical protein